MECICSLNVASISTTAAYLTFFSLKIEIPVKNGQVFIAVNSFKSYIYDEKLLQWKVIVNKSHIYVEKVAYDIFKSSNKTSTE